MKKFVPMVVVAACVATAAFASVRQPAATVSTQQTIVDTLPKDTTQLPETGDTTAPATTTDTSTNGGN